MTVAGDERQPACLALANAEAGNVVGHAIITSPSFAARMPDYRLQVVRADRCRLFPLCRALSPRLTEKLISFNKFGTRSLATERRALQAR